MQLQLGLLLEHRERGRCGEQGAEQAAEQAAANGRVRTHGPDFLTRRPRQAPPGRGDRIPTLRMVSAPQSHTARACSRRWVRTGNAAGGAAAKHAAAGGTHCMHESASRSSRGPPVSGPELYRALFEKAPDAITVYDIGTGRMVEANDSASALFGRSR